jgi:hypothetical protein
LLIGVSSVSAADGCVREDGCSFARDVVVALVEDELEKRPTPVLG